MNTSTSANPQDRFISGKPETNVSSDRFKTLEYLQKSLKGVVAPKMIQYVYFDLNEMHEERDKILAEIKAEENLRKMEAIQVESDAKAESALRYWGEEKSADV